MVSAKQMTHDSLVTSVLGPATKADAVYAELRARIIEARLLPGARLDQETLASSLGVSTTPLREALRRLESERLVQRAAHREVMIAPLSRAELAELYEVRADVDVLAVRLAAGRASPADLAESRVMLEMTDQGENLANLKANRAFHRSLYLSSRNGVLIEMLDWLWDRSDRYRFVLADESQELTSARREHAAILAAISAGDGDLAAKLMRHHLVGSRATIDDLLTDGYRGVK
jgi:DNA-binding GntR family transcriptional regulator